jgi:hypothetical protein
MTFEFAPDWMETLLRSSTYVQADLGISPLIPTVVPPAHPDARQMAALVSELFAEGTLSAEQFHSLITSPELEPFLDSILNHHAKQP